MQSLEECVTNGNRTVEQLAEEVAVLKQERRQRELKIINAEQAGSSTPPTSNDERSLLDDTTPTIKQSYINSEGDTTDDTDVLSQEIA